MPRAIAPKAAFLALLACSFAFAGAQDGVDLRRSLSSEEQWLLAAVLSDEAQKKAFEADAAKAAAATAAERAGLVMKWRKKVVEFTRDYKKHLDTVDIDAKAPRVEKMVSPYEHAVTMHWLNCQTPKKREEYLGQIKDANLWLLLARGTVADKIREARKQGARELGAYLATPQALAAAAYVEPAPPADPVPAAKALDQLGEAARAAGEALRAGVEAGARLADKDFSGRGEAPRSPVAIPSAPGAEKELPPQLQKPSDSPALANGFKIKPPPDPALQQTGDAPAASAFGAFARKIGLPILGVILGAVALGLVLGPLAIATGAIIGFAAGKMAGDLL